MRRSRVFFLVLLDFLLLLFLFRYSPFVFELFVLAGFLVCALLVVRRASSTLEGRVGLALYLVLLSSTIAAFTLLHPAKFVGDEAWDYLPMTEKAAYEPGFSDRGRMRHYLYPMVLSVSQLPNKFLGLSSPFQRVFTMRLAHIVFSVSIGVFFFYLVGSGVFGWQTSVFYVLLFFSSKPWFNPWWGVFHVMMDGVFIGVFLGLVYSLVFMEGRRGLGVSGFLFGLLFMLKIQALWLFPSVIVYLALFRRREYRSFPYFFVLLAVMSLVFLVVEYWTYGEPAHSLGIALRHHEASRAGLLSFVDPGIKPFFYVLAFRNLFSLWGAGFFLLSVIVVSFLEWGRSSRILALAVPYLLLISFYSVQEVRFMLAGLALLFLFPARLAALVFSRTRPLGIALFVLMLYFASPFSAASGWGYSVCGYTDDGVVARNLVDELESLDGRVTVGSLFPVYYPPFIFEPHDYEVSVKGWHNRDLEAVLERVSSRDYVVFNGLPEYVREFGFVGRLKETHVESDLGYCGVRVFRKRVDAVSDGSRRESRQAAGSRRVLLVGVGAAEWKHILPLVAEGRLPNIGRLMDSGVYADLLTVKEGVTGPMWTTMATGKPESMHGIHYRERDFGGGYSTCTSNMRRVKAVWNILSDYNITVGVVGWPYTWPAEEVNGFMVSPYMTYRLGRERQYLRNVYPKQFTSQPTVYAGAFLNQTYPPGLYRDVEDYIIEAEEGLDGYLGDFIKLPADYGGGDSATGSLEFIETLKWLLVSDKALSRMAVDFYAREKPDFFAYYVTGLDPVIHRYYQPRAIQEYGDVIENYWVFTDSVIGELVEAAGEDVLVMVVSEHGMGMASDHMKQTYPGIIIVSGYPFDENRIFYGPRQEDIVPTILYHLGVPEGVDMPGEPLFNVMRGLMPLGERRWVETHDEGWRYDALAIPNPFYNLTLERMRALGYLRKDTDIVYAYMSDNGFEPNWNDYLNWNRNRFYVHFGTRDGVKKYCFRLQGLNGYSVTIDNLQGSEKDFENWALDWRIDLSDSWDNPRLDVDCHSDPWGCMWVDGDVAPQTPFTLDSSTLGSQERKPGYVTIEASGEDLCFNVNNLSARGETRLGYSLEILGHISTL